MAKLLATRSAQTPLFAEFVWNFDDWVTDTADGVKKTFGKAVTGTGTAAAVDPVTGATVPGLTSGTAVTFDAIPLPLGAVVVGGELIVETAYVGIGIGATLTVGTSASAACYLASYDIDAGVASARSALLLTTALSSNTGANVRITLAGMTATATAGKIRLRIQYTIDGRQSEVQGA